MRGVDLDCSSGSHPTSDSRHPVLVVDIHGSYDSLRGLIPLGAIFFSVDNWTPLASVYGWGRSQAGRLTS